MHEDRKSDPQVATFTPGDVSGVIVRAFRSSERHCAEEAVASSLGTAADCHLTN